jgi:hypothetical protein
MTKKLPSYERIFGELDFKKGRDEEEDKARSVYSPAAYLADLLQLLDDEFEPHSFDERRSDIKEILLDAKNSFEEIPYLKRVNEILANKIKKDASDTDAFEVIRREAVYPFNLPQDIDYETVKVYLQHLGVKAEVLYKLFDERPEPELLAKAYLGIFEQQWCQLIENPRTGNKLAACYGFTDIEKLKKEFKLETNQIDIDKFVTACNISEIELIELVYQNLNTKVEREL